MSAYFQRMETVGHSIQANNPGPAPLQRPVGTAVTPGRLPNAAPGGAGPGTFPAEVSRTGGNQDQTPQSVEHPVEPTRTVTFRQTASAHLVGRIRGYR